MRRSKAIFHRQVFAALAAGEQLSEKAPDDVLSFSQRLLVWFFVIIPKKSVVFPSAFAKQNGRPDRKVENVSVPGQEGNRNDWLCQLLYPKSLEKVKGWKESLHTRLVGVTMMCDR